MMRAAYQLALANPQVRAEVIEVNEFPELGERYQVRAVPLTVIADKVAIPGAMHPDALVEQVLKAAGARGSARTPEAGRADLGGYAGEAPPPVQRGEQRPSGLIIP